MDFGKTNGKKKITIEIDEEVLENFSQYVDDLEGFDATVELAMQNYILVKNKTKRRICTCNTDVSLRPATKPNQFYQYLTEIAIKSNSEHYSLNTANGYVSAINTIGNIIGKNLWNETSYEKIQNIVKDLNNNSYYNKKNKDSNKTLSNGLARYCEFIAYCNNVQMSDYNENMPIITEPVINETSLARAKNKIRDWAYKDNDFHKIITAFFIAKNFFDDRDINKRLLQSIFEHLGGTNWGYFSPMSNGNPDSSTGQFFSVYYAGSVKLFHEEIKKTLTEYANCYYDESQEDYYKRIVECL